MRLLVRIIETVTEIFSGHVQAWLTLALMILVMIDVTSRYVMQNPLAISDEYGGFCLVAITCIGLAYAWKTAQPCPRGVYYKKTAYQHAAMAAPFHPFSGHCVYRLHGVRGLQAGQHIADVRHPKHQLASNAGRLAANDHRHRRRSHVSSTYRGNHQTDKKAFRREEEGE